MEKNMKCPFCGGENSSIDRFCKYCGSENKHIETNGTPKNSNNSSFERYMDAENFYFTKGGNRLVVPRIKDVSIDQFAIIYEGQMFFGISQAPTVILCTSINPIKVGDKIVFNDDPNANVYTIINLMDRHRSPCEEVGGLEICVVGLDSKVPLSVKVDMDKALKNSKSKNLIFMFAKKIS